MEIRLRVTLIVLAPVLAAIGPMANAQTPTSNVDLFRAFIASDFHKGLILRAIDGVPPAVFEKCPSLVSNSSRITPLKPVTFGASGLPNSGLWKESFPVSGCGDDTILNFYFTAGKDEKINTIIGIPRTTRGDPVLQRDAVLYANMGAQLVARDCKKFDVKSARFEAYGLPDPPSPDPGPSVRFRPWWETWTVVGCGHVIDVPLDFTPDDKGVRIVMRGLGVKERQAH
jgi:hypothetical protein